MDAALIMVAIGAFGLIFGSFLNVVIFRVPRRESIIFPASHCPHCGHDLEAKDNIPLIGFLFLRGRCRYCGQRISSQYPLVEAATSLVFVGAYGAFGFSPKFFAALLFLLVLLVVSVIDIHEKIIPNVIIVPAIVAALLGVVVASIAGLGSISLVGRQAWFASLIGFLIGGGLLYILAVAWPGGMGGGDVKLAAFMGIFLGYYVVVALFLGFLLGSIGGVAAMAWLNKGRKDQIPFGPYLALGSVLGLFISVPVTEWYLKISGFS